MWLWEGVYKTIQVLYQHADVVGCISSWESVVQASTIYISSNFVNGAAKFEARLTQLRSQLHELDRDE